MEPSDPLDALPVQVRQKMAADEWLHPVDTAVRTDLPDERGPVLEISE